MHRLGRYELICELWPTPIGTRYVARDAGGPVAVQQIAAPMPDRALGELRELGTLATRLRHPRLGAVMDLVLDAETAIVSEYAHAVSLRSLMGLARLGRAPLPVSVVLRIVIDLLEALDAVENSDGVMGGAARALHGGVTPDAVLVADSGDTILADGALTAVVAEGSGAWRHPDLLAYRAPEQLEPEAVASARTDLYAVGVLLWELLENRALFGQSVTRARTVRPGTPEDEAPASTRGWLADDVDAVHARQNVIERIQFAHVPRVQGVSHGLADVIDRAIARAPAVRPSSAIELAYALDSLEEPIASWSEVAATLSTRVGHLLAARQVVLSGA